MLPDPGDHDRAFAYRRGHPLYRPRPHVADGKNTGVGSLKRRGRLAEAGVSKKAARELAVELELDREAPCPHCGQPVRRRDEAAHLRRQHGIYEFDGEKMKLCFAGPGKDRPTAYTAEAGPGHTLTVWVREKKQ